MTSVLHLCMLKQCCLLVYQMPTFHALQEPGAAPAPVKPPPTEDDALDDSKFDEFMGSDAGAFASFGEYDQVLLLHLLLLKVHAPVLLLL